MSKADKKAAKRQRIADEKEAMRQSWAVSDARIPPDVEMGSQLERDRQGEGVAERGSEAAAEEAAVEEAAVEEASRKAAADKAAAEEAGSCSGGSR